MSSDFHAIVLAIAGPLTQRTLENLRRTLEDLWVKSTAQDGDPASFTPELIAQAHEAARQDNARIIVSWAQAIQIAADNAEANLTAIQNLQRYIETEKDKLAFVQRDANPASKTIQRIEANILELKTRLRDLQEPQATVPGHSPHEGSSGSESIGHINLDGNLSGMPPTDP